jgi:benzoyl-CoA reductase/2-hydroxyglutaryl-CoA dehydratase subunit BcrC/BadD/HgdB
LFSKRPYDERLYCIAAFMYADLAALKSAERDLRFSCFCMPPNTARLKELSALIEKTKPDIVIDIVLHSCHAYNIESAKVDKPAR